MAVSNLSIEVNERPLDKNALDELIRFSGYKVDMYLQYSPESDVYLIFVKYHQNQVVRQVYTQRHSPRKFKDIQRAIDWGKKIGFSSLSFSLDYALYPEGV